MDDEWRKPDKHAKYTHANGRELPVGDRFEKGKSGNPAGRPISARRLLNNEFFKTVLADWVAHGAEAVKKTREDYPTDYLRIVASILPKHLNVEVSQFDGVSDEQLAVELRAGLRQLAAGGFDLGLRDGEAEKPTAAGKVPTLQ